MKLYTFIFKKDNLTVKLPLLININDLEGNVEIVTKDDIRIFGKIKSKIYRKTGIKYYINYINNKYNCTRTEDTYEITLE